MRLTELESEMKTLYNLYHFVKQEIEDLESGRLDHRLEEFEQDINKCVNNNKKSFPLISNVSSNMNLRLNKMKEMKSKEQQLLPNTVIEKQESEKATAATSQLSKGIFKIVSDLFFQRK